MDRSGARGALPALLLAFTAWLGAPACSGVRPSLTPLPGAPVDTLRVGAATLVTVLRGVLESEGLQVRTTSPAEGYLESAWYDLDRERPGGAATSAPHWVIRLRFFADPVSEHETVLVSEAVYRQTSDPSVPVREREMLALAGHPGHELLARVLSTVRVLFGRGSGA